METWKSPTIGSRRGRSWFVKEGNGSATSRRDHSFVVVLWLEDGHAEQDAEWRWRVRCVHSGEEKCFRRVGDVLAYVSREAGAPPPQ